MITFKQSAKINAAASNVFALVADFKRIPEWRTDVPGISEVNGPPQTGTTFLEEVHFMGKKQLLMKVIELIPGRLLTIEAQSGMPLLPTQRFRFTQQGNETLVELEVEMRTKGFFRLMEFMLPAQLRKIWAKYFDNLNKLIQADQPKSK